MIRCYMDRQHKFVSWCNQNWWNRKEIINLSFFLILMYQLLFPCRNKATTYFKIYRTLFQYKVEMKNIEINHGILHLPSISPQIIYPHFCSLFETTRFKLVISLHLLLILGLLLVSPKCIKLQNTLYQLIGLFCQNLEI